MLMGARRDTHATQPSMFIVRARRQDRMAVCAVRRFEQWSQHATGFRKELRQPERIGYGETERKQREKREGYH